MIHGKIMVDHLVSQPDDCFPWYFGMPVSDIVRYLPPQAPYFFDIAFHGIDKLLLSYEFLIETPAM